MNAVTPEAPSHPIDAAEVLIHLQSLPTLSSVVLDLLNSVDRTISILRLWRARFRMIRH